MGYAKRQLTRGLLFAHFLGLTLSLGAIFTNIMVERHTRGGSLEMLSIGRDLVTLSSRSLIQTGFLITVFSGIAVTLLRYGLRTALVATQQPVQRGIEFVRIRQKIHADGHDAEDDECVADVADDPVGIRLQSKRDAAGRHGGRGVVSPKSQKSAHQCFYRRRYAVSPLCLLV